MYPINETCLPSLFVFGYTDFLSMYIVFLVKKDESQVFKKILILILCFYQLCKWLPKLSYGSLETLC